MSRSLAEKIFRNKLNHKELIFIDKKKVQHLIKDLLTIVYPYINNKEMQSVEDVYVSLKNVELELYKILKHVLPQEESTRISTSFVEELEQISELVEFDAQAIFKGDPAAKSLDEVLLCYPGLMAIAIYRMSHFLYREKVPVLPRMFTEYAHSRTGIDIHPGAKIGKHFYMDHGNGVVIGETTVIGENVKIYQGVTLGALSVSKKLESHKRHPTIEDSVVIYAHATILGGETTIGENSVIGGNVWLTHSVPANSVVYHKSEIKFDCKTPNDVKNMQDNK